MKLVRLHPTNSPCAIFLFEYSRIWTVAAGFTPIKLAPKLHLQNQRRLN